jgi:hypothetical protein
MSPLRLEVLGHVVVGRGSPRRDGTLPRPPLHHRPRCLLRGRMELEVTVGPWQYQMFPDNSSRD